MADNCDCADPFQFTTGVPFCQELARETIRIIMVPTVDGSGVRNGLEIANLPDSAAITALINNSDTSKRFSPVGGPTTVFRELTDERAETITQEFGDGSIFPIKPGPRSFLGTFTKQNSSLSKELNKAGCSGISVYLISADDKLIGDGSVDGWLYPMIVKDGTWESKPIPASFAAIPTVTLGFQFSDLLKDDNIGFIKSSTFEAGFSWLGTRGLLAIYGSAATAITVNGFTMAISNKYGEVPGQPQPNLKLADFECNEISPTPAPVPLASALESTSIPGSYAFVFTAPQVSADVVAVNIAATTFGLEDSNLVDDTVTIP